MRRTFPPQAGFGRRAETARANPWVPQRPSSGDAARVPASSGLRAACRNGPSALLYLPAPFAGRSVRVPASSGHGGACRNASNELPGVLGEGGVRSCLERAPRRASWPVVSIAGRPGCALLPSLHVIPLARARPARCFTRIGPKARSAHICTLSLHALTIESAPPSVHAVPSSRVATSLGPHLHASLVSPLSVSVVCARRSAA